MKTLLFLLMSISFAMSNKADKGAPILKIARSIDLNEVHYFVNVDDQGRLNHDEPLKLLWKNHKKGGNYEELNWIKKKYGYGVKNLGVDRGILHFQFVSYNKKKFFLQKNSIGQYAIFGNFDNKEIELSSIFVNIKGGGFWTPNVVSVDLKGVEVKSQNSFVSVLKP